MITPVLCLQNVFLKITEDYFSYGFHVNAGCCAFIILTARSLLVRGTVVIRTLHSQSR